MGSPSILCRTQCKEKRTLYAAQCTLGHTVDAEAQAL